MTIPKSFYFKVYKIVDNPSLDPIISWSESNHSFIVWDVKALCREILPKYAGLDRNYTQFVSELRFYGFERVAGSAQQEFGNADFVRGQPNRLKKMLLRRMAKIYAMKVKIARDRASQDRVKVENLLQDLRL